LYSLRCIFVEGKNDVKVLDALKKRIYHEKLKGYDEFIESTVISMNGKNKSQHYSELCMKTKTPHKFIFDADALFHFTISNEILFNQKKLEEFFQSDSTKDIQSWQLKKFISNFKKFLNVDVKFNVHLTPLSVFKQLVVDFKLKPELFSDQTLEHIKDNFSKDIPKCIEYLTGNGYLIMSKTVTDQTTFCDMETFILSNLNEFHLSNSKLDDIQIKFGQKLTRNDKSNLWEQITPDFLYGFVSKLDQDSNLFKFLSNNSKWIQIEESQQKQ
jgi:hypothetical protein